MVDKVWQSSQGQGHTALIPYIWKDQKVQSLEWGYSDLSPFLSSFTLGPKPIEWPNHITSSEFFRNALEDLLRESRRL